MLAAGAPDEPLARLSAALTDAGLSIDTQALTSDALTREQRQAIQHAPVVLLALGRPDFADTLDAPIVLAAREGGLAVVTFADRPVPAGAANAPRFDLSAWRGGAGNPTLGAVVRHCQAIADARRQVAGRRGLRRWLVGGSIGGVVALGFSVTGIDLFNVQQQVCSFPGPQPTISDLCGAIGLGNRPTRTERLAWEQRPAGSCAALIRHIRRFPDGALLPQAHALYAARTATRVGWSERVETLPLRIPVAISGPGDRAATLARGQGEARDRCAMYAGNRQIRVASAAAVPTDWLCDADGCSFTGEARCTLIEEKLEETCPTELR